MYDLERLLEELLETDASPGALHLVLSKLKDRGSTSLVVQQCRKALNLHPNRDDLRTLLAEAYLEQGLAAHASEELEGVTRRLDEAAGAYKLLAEAFERQGRYEEAAASLDRYLAHHPEDAQAGETLAGLRPPAPETAAAAAGPAPDDAGAAEGLRETPGEAIPEIATPTLAELYYSQGQIDAAIETYERILARAPDDPRASASLRELKALGAAPAEPPAFEDEIPEAAPAEEPEAEAVEPAAPEGDAFQEEVPEAAPVEELAPEVEAPQTMGPSEEAFEPEVPATPLEAESPEPAGQGEAALEAETAGPSPAWEPEAEAVEPAAPEGDAFEGVVPEAAPDEELAAGSGPASAEETAASAAERRRSRKMIAVLEEWLTRIHETGTNAPA
jgi:tetratricopeptide (TPR) repeat protein